MLIIYDSDPRFIRCRYEDEDEGIANIAYRSYWTTAEIISLSKSALSHFAKKPSIGSDQIPASPVVNKHPSKRFR